MPKLRNGDSNTGSFECKSDILLPNYCSPSVQSNQLQLINNNNKIQNLSVYILDFGSSYWQLITLE